MNGKLYSLSRALTRRITFCKPCRNEFLPIPYTFVLVSMLKFMHEWLYTTRRYVPNYTANVCASLRRPHNIVTSQLQRRYCEGISPFSPLTRIKAWTLTFYVFFNVSLCKEYFYSIAYYCPIFSLIVQRKYVKIYHFFHAFFVSL